MVMMNATRLMVVDDEPDLANVMKMALEKEGFLVDAFTDPQEALDYFKPDYYAMVITDVRMSNMNGFELYRELKKLDSTIRVACL